MPKKSLRPSTCSFPCPKCIINIDIELFERSTRSSFYCKTCRGYYICTLPLGKIEVSDEIKYLCPVDHTELEENPFRHKEIQSLIEKAKELLEK